MSGSSLPYRLRPHKSVDRRLFVDLLVRYERWRPLSRFAYVSMGAYPLEDHKMVHRALGIHRLITFDADRKIVDRQMFNRPVDSCFCCNKTSGEIISGLDEVLSDAGADDADGLVFWLDYTSPSKLGEQIREFQALLDKLANGDLVRVTVNAHLPALGDARDDDGTHLLAEEVRDLRFEKLKQRIGDFLPANASSSDMTQHGLAKLLMQAFRRAASNALPVTGGSVFAPLSIVRYSDGQQMVSMTGALVDRTKKEEMRSKIQLQSWPFSSLDWEHVHGLSVPDLTLRERMFLERAVASAEPEELASELGFDFEDDIDMVDFLENYKKFYRFYPTLLSAET